jgi:hypothetical protein
MFFGLNISFSSFRLTVKIYFCQLAKFRLFALDVSATFNLKMGPRSGLFSCNLKHYNYSLHTGFFGVIHTGYLVNIGEYDDILN